MTTNFLGPLGAFGVIIAIGITIYWWERRPLRIVPFVYATTFTFLWFVNKSDSITEVVKAIGVVNTVTGVLLFVAWLQVRK